MGKHDKNEPIVSIAGICAGVMLPIVVVVVIFAREWTWILAPICGALALMGIFLGCFASRSEKSMNSENRSEQKQ